MPTDGAARPALLHLLLGAVLLAPLALGAVEPWAWGALALAVGALLLAWSVRLARGLRAPVSLRRIWLPAACFALAALWIALQAAPVTPTAWRHPLWAEAAALLGLDLAGAVSLNPAEGWNGLLRLLTYGAVFYLALNLCRSRDAAGRAVAAVAAAAALYALYGLAAFLSGSETILWLDKTSYRGDLTATFVNRNSFATFAGLGLICTAAMLVEGLRRAWKPGVPRREQARLLLEYLTARGAVWLGAALVLGSALLLSHSRAGLTSALAGILVLLALVAAARLLSARRAALVAVLAGSAFVALFALSGAGTFERLMQAGDHAEARLAAYDRTIAAIGDAPFLGTGFGSFRDAFRMYRTESIRDPFHYAHNSYIENAMELGLPGAAVLYLAVGGVVAIALAGLFRRRRDLIFPAVGVAASVLVGLHSLVDFSLQIPAVAAVYALLMGAACAQSWSSRTDTSA